MAIKFRRPHCNIDNFFCPAVFHVNITIRKMARTSPWAGFIQYQFSKGGANYGQEYFTTFKRACICIAT
mgnify:CR=1 FL=1